MCVIIDKNADKEEMRRRWEGESGQRMFDYMVRKIYLFEKLNL